MNASRAFKASTFLATVIPVLFGLCCHREPQAPTIEELLAKTALSLEEQTVLADKLFQEMHAADEDDLALFERNYLAVLGKCPDTDKAHTSVWRLTNLYSRAYDEPQYEKIVAILEPFLERYKTSPVVSMKKYSDDILVFSPIAALHLAYAQLGRHDLIAAYYDRVAAAGEDMAPLDCFDFAEALETVSRTEEAVRWYKAFLDKTDGDDSLDFLRETAEERIRVLGPPRP